MRLDAWEVASAPPDWAPASEPIAYGDDGDWWFRTTFAADRCDDALLHLDGIATVSEVTLNGEPILASSSMFERHTVQVGALLRGENELVVRCRALAPLLEERRKPRARWRTTIAHSNLRFFRTTLFGRAPGFAPGPPLVGVYRPVHLERPGAVALDSLALRARLDGDDGVLSVRSTLRGADALEVSVAGVAAELPSDGGELRVPGVAKWWPHTHGEPVLHEVRMSAGGEELAVRRVGFRSIEWDDDSLRLNGVPVFCRGAVWTPVAQAELRPTLELARDAGMNMVRVPGTGAYESDEFWDACDDLGLLVWQDFMFANFDYPIADDDFRELVEREAGQQVGRAASHPALAVLCGGSEVEQQVAMTGLDPALGRGELFEELLPRVAREREADVPYVPSAPCGGDLPFRTNAGVANYYGVGAYLRPLEDARRAEVRFAAECLAFANMPGEETVAAMGAPAVHDPRWKAGVPRDVGAGWDFDDVRDHYLRLLYGVDPVALRSTDHARYLELSRAVSGEVMAETFGEWRREGSPCGGACLLWLRDLVPGAGWGVIDALGEPKAALRHLSRALAPVAVWTTDEGLNGIDVHVANDRPEPLRVRLRVALYRDFETPVGDAAEEIEVPAHGYARHGVEAMLGRFADVAAAYGFGPPAQDLVAATLERDGAVLSQAFRCPAGRPAGAEAAATLGLTATATPAGDGDVKLLVGARRFAYGVNVHVPGYSASDDAFSVEPGQARELLLRPTSPGAEWPGGGLTALNLRGRVRIESAAETG